MADLTPGKDGATLPLGPNGFEIEKSQKWTYATQITRLEQRSEKFNRTVVISHCSFRKLIIGFARITHLAVRG